MLDGNGDTITKTGNQPKSSTQIDTNTEKINNIDADTHSPRHDQVTNPFAAMRKDSFPTNE